MPLDELYVRYADRVRATIYRETGSHDAAEELTHEAFIRLSAKLSAAREPIALLTTIVGGLVKDWYRAERRRRNIELPGGASQDLDRLPEGLLPTWQGYAFGLLLDNAVRALAKGPRDAFILTTLRGLSQGEAASVLGITQQAVHLRMKAATASVREDVT